MGATQRGPRSQNSQRTGSAVQRSAAQDAVKRSRALFTLIASRSVKSGDVIDASNPKFRSQKWQQI